MLNCSVVRHLGDCNFKLPCTGGMPTLTSWTTTTALRYLTHWMLSITSWLSSYTWRGVSHTRILLASDWLAKVRSRVTRILASDWLAGVTGLVTNIRPLSGVTGQVTKIRPLIGCRTRPVLNWNRRINNELWSKHKDLQIENWAVQILNFCLYIPMITSLWPTFLEFWTHCLLQVSGDGLPIPCLINKW